MREKAVGLLSFFAAFEMMRLAAFVLVILVKAGCIAPPCKTIVLQYRDFGPQAAAYETIGMEWWQWDNHGDPAPNYRYNIKVVVYRDIPLAKVQQAYPVLKEREQDYRYLAYSEAIAYLDKQIRDDVLPEVTKRLQQTKERIEEELGKPND